MLAELKLRINVETIFDSVRTRIVGCASVSRVELRKLASADVLSVGTDAILIRIGFEPNAESVRGMLDLNSRIHCRLCRMRNER